MRHTLRIQTLIKTVVITISLLLILTGSFQLLNRPAKDYDEWNYVNVFTLVNQGKQLYKEVFFSQPPGFFVAVNPNFVLFGKSLQAARLSLLLWSLFGLLGMIWLSHEMRNIWVGFFAIGILYTMPQYFKETVTLRADVLIPVFSVYAIASMMRYGKSLQNRYLILSTIFFFASFFVKLDFSTFFPLILIYLAACKKDNFKAFVSKIAKCIIFFSTTMIIFIGLFMKFFDWKAFLDNVIVFGIRALFHFPFSNIPGASTSVSIWHYLPLLTVLTSGLAVGIYKIVRNKTDYYFNILFIWSLSTLFMLIFYKPFLSHQLVFSTVPFSMMISYFFIDLIKKYRYIHILIIFFVLCASIIFSIYSFTTPKGIITKNQQEGLNIILRYTLKNDYIITDDYSLVALSGRKTIPELADVSLVRIISGDLSADVFHREILKYKPKLIVAWTERLTMIRGFEEIIKNYRLLKKVDGTHKIYILNN